VVDLAVTTPAMAAAEAQLFDRCIDRVVAEEFN
jgi:hypothetical protein